jgi:biopolymer transport protein ExbD
MIARPLEIASRLQPSPRNFDLLFYVNGGLIVLFFMLFGSRFVLAPGLDLVLPEVGGARAAAGTTTCYISVKDSGQIYTGYGMLNFAQLQDWLKARARDSRQPALLIRASDHVSANRVAEISSMAYKNGFVRVIMAAEEPETHGTGSP